MAFKDVIDTLREEERQLTKQLSGIRAAITALGSNLSYVVTGRGGRPGRPAGSTNQVAPRKKRRLSAKARAAISRAQKLRWAKQKALGK